MIDKDKNVADRKPDSHTKTDKATVQTHTHEDGSITITKGICGYGGKDMAGDDDYICQDRFSTPAISTIGDQAQ